MDRILRVAPWALATVFLGLAAPIGRAAPNDLSGRLEQVVSRPAMSPPGTALERLPPTDELSEPAEMPPAETAPALVPPAISRLPKVLDLPRETPAPAAPPQKTAAPERERSAQLEQVARQADQQTRHGLELAGRGACFAARSEFIAALRLIAECLDTEQKSNAHGRALAAALTAMKEAEDFLPGGSRSEAELDLPGIIAAHATPALKGGATNVTSMTAMNRYFTFAQEQFAAAAGHELAGSMALHALGKMHAALAIKKNSLAAAAEPKAMAFYQAAIMVYPGNFLSANDLGVLLARCGNYADARKMLEYSFALSQQSATSQNLAEVYRQLGQAALADRAARQAAMLQQLELARRRTSLGSASDVVRWVDPQTFSKTSMNTPNSPGATPPPPTYKR
jgi:tetratricopeptide (TPR) repeat protein